MRRHWFAVKPVFFCMWGKMASGVVARDSAILGVLPVRLWLQSHVRLTSCHFFNSGSDQILRKCQTKRLGQAVGTIETKIGRYETLMTQIQDVCNTV